MQPLKNVLYEESGPIARLILNRPEIHNAFDATTIQELSTLLSVLDNNSNIRILIIMAHGKHFCAGAHLQWMQDMASYTTEQNQADALALAKVFSLLANLSKVTMALVHGAVMGGGCGLAACCDLVIASQDAHFCFSEVKLGLIPATIAPYIIQRMGYQATRRYFITAESIDSSSAEALQLVDRVVPREALLQKAEEYARQISQNSPEAIKEVKKLLRCITPIDQSLIESTAFWLAKIRSSPEAQEGLAAFFEKRKPSWTLDL